MSFRRKACSIAALAVLALLGVFSFFLVSGVASAFQAKDRFQSLERELAQSGFADLRESDTYLALANQFGEAEHLAGRARSRLRFASLFTWLPGIGGRIRESRTQLDMAFYLARAGRNLATAYQIALGSPMNGEEPGRQVTLALEKESSVLEQVGRDLERGRLLRLELGPTGLDSRYASLFNNYLPQIQALTYISRSYPQVIGQAYELNLELAAVKGLVTDPLQVLANPDRVDDTLDRVIERARELTAELQSLRRSANESPASSPSVKQNILEVVELMEHGVALLEQSTVGARGLLRLARASEDYGMLSRDFAATAEVALEQAEAGLSSAQAKSAALRSLLVQRELRGQDSQPISGFGNTINMSSVSLDRVEEVLERALRSTRFLNAFLGFRGPRTYLVLAQNQQEIRATGGFIAVAVQITLDEGQLVDLVYQDSTTVDLLPPAYPNNPLPPDPLYWYLWMGRLLFRDANWSPHFPTAAARVADIYRLGQGTQVDGVITVSKALMVDMVELLGDIRVPDSPEPLTSKTAQAYTDGDLRYSCSPRHVSDRGKRCFDEDVFFALWERLTTSISSQERAAVVQLLRTALARRNVLAHLFDSEEGSLLWDLGWNGAIRPVDHDYLLVVDSSLPGHTTEQVQRHWDYQVSLQVGQPVNARLRVRYDHQGAPREDRVCRQSEPESSNCYWNYFRIYLPGVATNVVAPPVPLDPGSEKLIWGYPDPDSSSLGLTTHVGPARLTEVGGFIAVAPDSVTTIPLEYQLPWETVLSTGPDSFEYRLLVDKQSGIDSDQVTVAVELPAGADLLEASPEPTARSGRWLFFRFGLDTEEQVVVSFKAPDGG